jgi:hypothetical protein
MATWLNKVESLYREGLSSQDRIPKGTAIDYLNTQRKLSEQRPAAPTVVWGKGGTHVRAAVVPQGIEEVDGLPVQGYVVDLNHYSISCSSTDEANYLAAMLNSAPVNTVVARFQTRGKFGNRDIHRRPFEHVPIPLFNEHDSRHTRLAHLSEELHFIASTVQASARLYERYMESLGTKIEEVDQLVRSVLS